MIFENSFKYFCYLQRLSISSYNRLDLQELYEKKLIEFNEKVDYDIRIEYRKLYDRLRGRRSTLRKKLADILLSYDEPLFLTLTFRDEILDNTIAYSRKKYIKEFLKNNCLEYVANIDFGKTNHREHYHAVVSNNISVEAIKQYRKKLGSINLIPIYSRNFIKLAHYLDKLVNHSFKDTTINKCIYSRKKKNK